VIRLKKGLCFKVLKAFRVLKVTHNELGIIKSNIGLLYLTLMSKVMENKRQVSVRSLTSSESNTFFLIIVSFYFYITLFLYVYIYFLYILLLICSGNFYLFIIINSDRLPTSLLN